MNDFCSKGICYVQKNVIERYGNTQLRDMATTHIAKAACTVCAKLLQRLTKLL